jgi:hypothetical protein
MEQEFEMIQQITDIETVKVGGGIPPYTVTWEYDMYGNSLKRIDYAAGSGWASDYYWYNADGKCTKVEEVSPP